MGKISYIIAIYLFFLSSCVTKNNNQTNLISNNDSIHIINIDEVTPQKNIKLSSLFTNVKTVILENQNDVLIGKINKIYIYGDSILILDRSIAKCLFIFNKQGKFLKKIGDVGKGPGEYHTPQDFTVDENNKELYILDSNLDKINKYDLKTGEFISSVRLDNKGKIRSFYIQCINGKIYGDAYFAVPSKNNYLLREINFINGKEEGKWLNKVEYNKGWDEIFFTGESPFAYNNSNSSKYMQLFMDEVISITSEKITPFLKLKSKDLINAKDLKNELGNDAHSRYSSLIGLNKIHGIHNYIEFGNRILFQYYHGNSISVVLYDIIKRETEIFYNITDDLIYNSDYKGILYPNFHFFDEKNIYSYINSNQMGEFVKLAKNNLLSLNLDKRNELLQLTEDSNPVIFYYEYE